MATDLKEETGIGQKEEFLPIDYESSGSGRLEAVISKAMNQLFVSPGCADDDNNAHSAENYHKTPLGQRMKSEVIPAMMLSAIGEIFGYRFLITKFELPVGLSLSELYIELGSPILPGEPFVYNVEKYSIGNYDKEDRSFSLEINARNEKGKKKIKKCSMTFSVPEPNGKLTEKEEGLEPINEKILTRKHLANYLKAIGYNLEPIRPAVLTAAATVSRALLNKAEQMNVDSAGYKHLLFTFYKDACRLGEQLRTYVQEDEGSHISKGRDKIKSIIMGLLDSQHPNKKADMNKLFKNLGSTIDSYFSNHFYDIITTNSEGHKLLEVKTDLRF